MIRKRCSFVPSPSEHVVAELHAQLLAAREPVSGRGRQWKRPGVLPAVRNVNAARPSLSSVLSSRNSTTPTQGGSEHVARKGTTPSRTRLPGRKTVVRPAGRSVIGPSPRAARHCTGERHDDLLGALRRHCRPAGARECEHRPDLPLLRADDGLAGRASRQARSCRALALPGAEGPLRCGHDEVEVVAEPLDEGERRRAVRCDGDARPRICPLRPWR